MEMFDHTYQDVLDQWSAGKLEKKEFLQKVHWYANWRYDFSLYQNILEFIKEHRLRLVGLNIPNYIPPRIREGGINNLRDDEKDHLPQQMDMSNTAHRDYVQKVFENHRHHFRGDVEFEDFYAAQSVWEDAMAEAIATGRIASDGKKDIALKIDKWARVMYLVMCAFTVIFDHTPLINCLKHSA